MECKDIYTGLGIIVSALIAVCGWFIQQKIDREQEKLKLRLAKRLEITDALIKHLWRLFVNIERGTGEVTGNAEEWHKLSLLIQVYGTSAEREQLQALGNPQTDAKVVEAFGAVLDTLKNAVRIDLGFKD